MRGVGFLSQFVFHLVFLSGLLSAPLLAAEDEIARAADGRALEALLSADPGAKENVVARARELGLDVVSVRVGTPPDSKADVRVAGGGKPFRDCPDVCPALVVVPASPAGFQIGSPDGEPGHLDDEKQVNVSVPAFAIGATVVTVAEYKACVADGGCPPPEWLEVGGQHNIETGSGRYYKNLGANITDPGQPIVGVSFDDATAYAAWLSSKTGHSYRLPSEAQWELAARAGTHTAYWWSDALPNDGVVRAVCADCGSAWDAKAPAAADAFAANPWGLFNVHGNVWEWTADFYCDDYSSGPRDGAPRLTDDCPARANEAPARGVRSLRGGSAFYPAKIMRSAMRLRNVPSFRNFSVGFRITRDLAP